MTTTAPELFQLTFSEVGNNDYRVKGGVLMAKYGKKSQEEIEKAMHEHKHGGKFKNKQQAVAVGLSKARREGSKAPKKKSDN